MAKKRNGENEAPEKENADIKQDDLIQQIVDELPIIRTKNYIEVQLKRTNRTSMVPIDSSEVFEYIVCEFKNRYGFWAKPNIIKNCIICKKNYGQDLDITELKHRIAYCDDSIVYDLLDGNCVVVNKNGWECKNRCE